MFIIVVAFIKDFDSKCKFTRDKGQFMVERSVVLFLPDNDDDDVT